MQSNYVAMTTVVACILLVCGDVTRISGDVTDTDGNFSTVLSQIERNLSQYIIQEESNSTVQRMQRMRKIRLKSLNFRFKNRKIYLTEVHMSLGEIKVQRSDIDLYGHRMDVRIALPALQVNGICRFAASESSDGVYLRLTMDRISAEGVAGVSPSPAGSDVSVAWLYLSTFTHDASQLQVVSLDGGETDSINSMPEMDSEQFKNLLISKFERDIIYQLSKLTKDKLNDVLKRRASLIMSPYATVIQDPIVNSTEHANTFIDSLLRFGGILIQEKYGDQVKIPDIHESFSRKVLLVTWQGSFKARDGSAVGTSTVYRIGDTAFGYDNESLVHFYGTLGFTQLRLYYDYYKAEVLGLGPSGTLDTKLEPVAVFVHVHINLTSNTIYLDEFKVENVGDMDVNLTGLGGLLNWLVSLVTTWVVGLFRDQILGSLESQYRRYATDVFASYSIDELFNTENDV